MAAAVPLGLQVIGGAMAAISVIKGLKEGNLFQAVLGGVGAYFAVSGLGAMTATAASTAGGAPGVVNAAQGAAGLETGMSAVTTAGGMNAGTAMTNALASGTEAAGSNLLTEGLSAGSGLAGGGSVGDYAFSGMGSAGLSSGANAAMAASGQGAAMPNLAMPEAAGGGFLSSASEPGSMFGATDVAAPGADTLVSGAGAAEEPGFLSNALGFFKENPKMLEVGGQILSGYAKGQQEEETIQRLMDERERERRSRGSSVNPSMFRLSTA